MSTFHNLDNEHVIFIYLTISRFLEEYERISYQRGTEVFVNLSDTTTITHFDPFSDEKIEELLKSDHYKYCKEVKERLEPIVEIIKDTFPEIYEKVSSSFSKSDEDDFDL